MIRAFLDANVLFAGVLSATGASRELFLRAISNEVTVILSEDVIAEARRNPEKKAPQIAQLMSSWLEVIPYELVTISSQEAEAAAEYTTAKDAVVVAAAVGAGAEYLVTLDRVHLLNVPQVAERSGLKIVLPGTLVQLLREQS